MLIIETQHRLMAVFDRRYTLPEMLNAAKVLPNSYASDLVERIHSCLFELTRDVKSEFDRFYSAEYSDFVHFLFWRYDIDIDTAEEINNRTSQNGYIGYGRDFIGMFEDERVSSILKSIFSELGEITR